MKLKEIVKETISFKSELTIEGLQVLLPSLTR
jgi:hypothetical protein